VAAVLAEPGSPNLVDPGDEAGFLAPHPSAMLTQDPDIRARLKRFGLRRIGAVAELPRSALVARFGEEGARMRARARGEELEPFRPRRTPERLRLALPLDPPAEDLDPLRFVLHRLAAALADQLSARGARLDWQLARLALTFGEDRVRRVAITDPEATLPERRWAWQPVISTEPGTAS
jgi:protein ImuB